MVPFGVLIANALVIGGSLTIPALLGAMWFGPLLVALLIVAEIALYSAMLQSAGRLLQNRREALVEALQA